MSAMEFVRLGPAFYPKDTDEYDRQFFVVGQRIENMSIHKHNSQGDRR